MSKKNKIRKETANKDKSPYIPQKNKIDKQITIHQKQELTEKQQGFLTLIAQKECSIIVLDGPAGSSKTFLAVLAALNSINEKRTSDIIYVRSAVESTDSKIGFIPGTSEEKLNPYIQPLLDKLDEFISPGDVDYLQKQERIKGKHTGYLRGLSWNAQFIIVDEAQNLSQKELVTVMTRIGKFSKMVIIGDSMQNDINGKSGFNKIFSIFNNPESENAGIFCLKFDKQDIVRSGIVKFIVEQIEKHSIK